MRVNSIFAGVCNLPLPYNGRTNLLNIKKVLCKIERQDLKANVFQTRFYSAGGSVEKNSEGVLTHTQTPAFSSTDELMPNPEEFLSPFIDLKNYNLSSNINIVMKDQTTYEMFKKWESLIGYDATYLNFFGSKEYKEGVGYTDSDLFWLTNHSRDDQLIYKSFKTLENFWDSHERACCAYFGCPMQRFNELFPPDFNVYVKVSKTLTKEPAAVNFYPDYSFLTHWSHISDSFLTQEYLPAGLLVGSAFFLALLITATSYLLAAQKPGTEKLSAYECGFEPYEDTKSRFNVQFCVVAVLFVLFDIELVVLTPWALSLANLCATGYWSVLEFLLELILGLIYVLCVGGFDWKKVS